ncbi:MAG: hypothetical protein KGD60_07685 [Candidatus Thorarchaeota archaeon]|nr:hypothetical protein [Candidatus Thorarchaeota archaeon]
MTIRMTPFHAADEMKRVSIRRITISEEWKSTAAEFRKILHKKPTDSAAVEALRKTGQLGTTLAGFWEFLVSNNLVEPKLTP